MKQTNFFKCLSDPTRLDILKLIFIKKRVCVCQFTQLLEVSQPKISRHLALLRNLQLLRDHRKGQWVYYSLNPDMPDWAKSIIAIIADQNTKMVNDNSFNLHLEMYCD